MSALPVPRPRLLLLCALLLWVMPHAARGQESTAQPAFPLQPGSAVEGNLSDSAPTILYQFAGAGGSVVSIQMDRTSGDLDPFLTLLGPDGELVEQDDDSGGGRNAAITATLNRTGTFTIEASRYSQGGASSSGTFRLALAVAGAGSGPSDPLTMLPDFDLEPAPGLIAYRETGVGRLETADSRRYFAFAGERGDLVRAIVSTAEGDLSPRVDVLNRELLSIASSEVQPRPTEAIAYATLPETGWYLIRAGARGGSGDFTLYVERLAAGAALAYGESISGQFAPDTPSISYIFNARAGDLIAANLFATEDDSGVAPELRLLNLDFETLTSGAGERFATLSADIERSGTYLLQAVNTAAAASGGFNLRLTGTPVDVSKLTVTPASYNEQVRGAITNAQPVRYVRFSGKAGELVTIQMTADEGYLDPYLILSDGDLSEELAFNDNAGTSRDARIARFRLERDGDYLIMATRAGLSRGTTAGPFTLALTVGDIALTGGALTASLRWNSAADLNLYVRDPDGRIVSWSNPSVPGGGQLQIDSNANCETPTDQPVEHIFWPDRALAAGDYDIWAWYRQACATGGPATLALDVRVRDEPILSGADRPVELAPGERYEARVRISGDGDAFVLAPGEITQPTPQQEASEGGDPLVVYGERVQGTLNDNIHTRFYQFRGQQGDRVVVAVETVAGDLDPVVFLRDAGDQTLPDGSSDDAGPDTRDARLTYTLPYSGTYVVAVTRYGGRSGATSGTYRLTLETTDVPAAS